MVPSVNDSVITILVQKELPITSNLTLTEPNRYSVPEQLNSLISKNRQTVPHIQTIPQILQNKNYNKIKLYIPT